MPYRVRARSTGLRQVTISRFLGRAESYVSRGIGGLEPRQPIRAIITAWEIMSPAQRIDWMDACGILPTRTRQPVHLQADRMVASVLALLASVLGVSTAVL